MKKRVMWQKESVIHKWNMHKNGKLWKSHVKTARCKTKTCKYGAALDVNMRYATTYCLKMQYVNKWDVNMTGLSM